MKKISKKFGLKLGLAFGALAAIVPTTVATTSCFSTQDTASKLKNLVGKKIYCEITPNTAYSGILLKVEKNQIWVDLWSDDKSYASSNIKAFNIPLKYDYFSQYPDMYVTRQYAFKIFEELKDYIANEFSYEQILKELDEFSATTINLPQVYQGTLKMYEIFKTYMADWSQWKIDEVIFDLRHNQSLKKWQEFVNYYVNTFAWRREDFFKIVNNLEKNYQINLPVPLLNNIKKFCTTFNAYAFGTHFNIKE